MQLGSELKSKSRTEGSFGTDLEELLLCPVCLDIAKPPLQVLFHMTFCHLFIKPCDHRCGSVQRVTLSVDLVQTGQNYWCAPSAGSHWLACSQGVLFTLIPVLHLLPYPRNRALEDLSRRTFPREAEAAALAAARERERGRGEGSEAGTGRTNAGSNTSSRATTRGFARGGGGQPRAGRAGRRQQPASQVSFSLTSVCDLRLLRLIRTLTSATFWHHALTQEHCSRQLQAWFRHHPLASCPLGWFLPPATKREAMTSPVRSSWRMWTTSSCQTSHSLMLL